MSAKDRLEGTKERILQAACQRFLESGEKGLSMRTIAKDVGVTPMAIYRHFENKDALQKALLAEAFRTFGDHLFPALKETSARTRFERTVDGYLEFAIRQPAYFELIFLSINPLNDLKAQEIIKKESLPSFRFLLDRVRECISDGYFREGDAYQMSVALLAQSTGIAALHLTRSFDWSDEEAIAMHRKVLEQSLSGFIRET